MKRAAHDDDNKTDTTVGEAKRLREGIGAIAVEWICPITQELPLDPVMAEDGRVYERRSIVEWIARSEDEKKTVTSPVTGAPMGTRLLTTTQVKNTIREAVATGAVCDKLAAAWTTRLLDERFVSELRKKIETTNDGFAMYQIAHCYNCGTRGLVKDIPKAWEWIERSAIAGFPLSMCLHGLRRLKHFEFADGLVWITRAATTEPPFAVACLTLGKLYRNGKDGVEKNEDEAARWFRRMEAATNKKYLDGQDGVNEALAWMRARNPSTE